MMLSAWSRSPSTDVIQLDDLRLLSQRIYRRLLQPSVRPTRHLYLGEPGYVATARNLTPLVSPRFTSEVPKKPN